MSTTKPPLFRVVHPDFPQLDLAIRYYPQVATIVEGTDAEGQPYHWSDSCCRPPIEILYQFLGAGCVQVPEGGASC